MIVGVDDGAAGVGIPGSGSGGGSYDGDPEGGSPAPDGAVVTGFGTGLVELVGGLDGLAGATVGNVGNVIGEAVEEPDWAGVGKAVGGGAGGVDGADGADGARPFDVGAADGDSFAATGERDGEKLPTGIGPTVVP